MATKLFVRSLAFTVTDASLSEFFAPVGTVVSANVIMDRDTNRSKGFGFVEMESEQAANDAIKQLDGKELEGRAVAVAIARPKEDRPARPSFGGGGGGQRNRY